MRKLQAAAESACWGKAFALGGFSAAFVAATVSSASLQSAHAQAVGEIVVTAEKRERSLQDVPIAVTALSGQAITEAGISQPTDLNELVPGLAVAQGGPSSQIYIRGVGNFSTSAFSEAAVAFNMDGVYISRFSGITGNFFDIERVEVLKGPQGTLYGRNATGGAVNIVTRKPVLDEFQSGLGIELGNHSLFRFDGYINAPVSEHVAIRLSGQNTARDGYQTDGNDDDQSSAGRLHILYEPNDSTSLLITGGILQLRGKGQALVPVTNSGFVDNENPWRGQSETLPGLLDSLPPAPGLLLFTGLDRTRATLDVAVKSIGVQFEHDLGGAALTLLANYLDNDNTSNFYGPGFQVDTRTLSEQFSAEARLSGDTDALDWVLGAYYFQEDQSENYWVDQGFLFNQTGFDIDTLETRAYAAFGQITYSMTDAVRLTGGLRYSWEEKTADGLTFFRQPMAFSCAASGTTQVFIDTVVQFIPQAATNDAGQVYPFPYCQDTVTGQPSWDDLSWRVGLDIDLTADSLLYLSASRGFKAGGIFAAGDTSIQGNVYEPETLHAYAVGSKNRFFDGRMTLNAEAFYWDYKDHQENYLAPTSSAGTFNFITQSADESEIYGLDVEMNALLTENDEFGIKLQLLNAEYTDAQFIIASPGPGNPSPLTVCSATQDAAVPAIWHNDCSGQQMPRAPDVSGIADYRHTFNLAGGGRIVAGGRLRYSSSYWSAVDYNPLQLQEEFVTYGLAITYYEPNDRWSLGAWGENLGEEVVYTNAVMYPSKNSVLGGGAGNVAMVQLDAPRTYGVRFRANF